MARHAGAGSQQPEYTRDNDWPFGGWQRDMPEGIRPYPYSTKLEVNPTTYEIINTADYDGVHAKGCVWATALYEGSAVGAGPLMSRSAGSPQLMGTSRGLCSRARCPPVAGYWNIVDDEGFVTDIYSGQGGNGMVLQVWPGPPPLPCQRMSASHVHPGRTVRRSA